MISYEDAALVIANRPDIISAFRSWGWSEAELQDYQRVVEEWWAITTEKDDWGGDIQNYISYLRGEPTNGGGPSNGGIIPSLPPIAGIDARIVLLAGAALVIGMVFFAD